MKRNRPAAEHSDAGKPFWLEGPQIDPSLAVLSGILALCFNGAWFWVWSIGDARRAVVIGTMIGLLISLVWCVIRIQRFDLHTWQWRNTTRPPHYGRATALIIGVASGAGALTARYIAQVTGLDFQLGLMASIFISCGILCIWSLLEGIRHLWYFRRRKRNTPQ